MPDFNHPVMVATNGIQLAIYEEKPRGSAYPFPVILVHGMPELAYSWRHQIPALAEAGFRVFAPNQRGYDGTGAPEAVEEYDIHNLTGDLIGLLDHYNLDQAVFVGHDWGGLVVWQVPLLHPTRVMGLAGLGVPFIPRPERDPIEMFRAVFGEDMYIVNFQTSHEADEYFSAHPERVFDLLMRRPRMTREEFDALPAEDKVPNLLERIKTAEPEGEPILSDAEKQVFIDTFRETGFTPPINWYRNFSRNWRTTVHV
ncbi:MAG: alpha/beta hydrolase, partial [Ketobacteraceae bacterium]|nr:alpha/beta hydrolase [Ketobacteraceae bacterium]